MPSSSSQRSSYPNGIATTIEYNGSADNAVIELKASAAELLEVIYDNVAGGADAYLHLFHLAAASVILGTTVPDWTLKLDAGKRRRYRFTDLNGARGFQLPTALSYAVVSTPNGVSSPATLPKIQINYT